MNLFNISEAANIAIHSLALIASGGKSLNVSQISEMMKFSKNHTAKVMQTLARNGVVTSTRGPQGGFRLEETAGEISILQIIELVDGGFESGSCRSCFADCPFETCVYGLERQNLVSRFKDYYSRRKLKDIITKNA
jgi:Rrf2 family protein